MEHMFMDVEKDIHNIKLRQMGAEVDTIRGVMYYVRFDIKGVAIKYVYHLNKKERYFLQRRAPYPLTFGVYDSKEDVINLIEHDISQIKNAINSKNFNKFIEINQKVVKVLRKFEDLYLYFNIPKEQADKIQNALHDLEDLIYETKNISERVYFEKEPESF